MIIRCLANRANCIQSVCVCGKLLNGVLKVDQNPSLILSRCMYCTFTRTLLYCGVNLMLSFILQMNHVLWNVFKRIPNTVIHSDHVLWNVFKRIPNTVIHSDIGKNSHVRP